MTPSDKSHERPSSKSQGNGSQAYPSSRPYYTRRQAKEAERKKAEAESSVIYFTKNDDLMGREEKHRERWQSELVEEPGSTRPNGTQTSTERQLKLQERMEVEARPTETKQFENGSMGTRSNPMDLSMIMNTLEQPYFERERATVEIAQEALRVGGWRTEAAQTMDNSQALEPRQPYTKRDRSAVSQGQYATQNVIINNRREAAIRRSNSSLLPQSTYTTPDQDSLVKLSVSPDRLHDSALPNDRRLKWERSAGFRLLYGKGKYHIDQRTYNEYAAQRDRSDAYNEYAAERDRNAAHLVQRTRHTDRQRMGNENSGMTRRPPTLQRPYRGKRGAAMCRDDPAFQKKTILDPRGSHVATYEGTEQLIFRAVKNDTEFENKHIWKFKNPDMYQQAPEKERSQMVSLEKARAVEQRIQSGTSASVIFGTAQSIDGERLQEANRKLSMGLTRRTEKASWIRTIN
ncbi:MAG: hypothetical protein M1812_005121 [Candelaria pacifica]|nr:MAG: hypothetical protein M1812_005121 [Candelaria pacifica]